VRNRKRNRQNGPAVSGASVLEQREFEPAVRFQVGGTKIQKRTVSSNPFRSSNEALLTAVRFGRFSVSW